MEQPLSPGGSSLGELTVTLDYTVTGQVAPEPIEEAAQSLEDARRQLELAAGTDNAAVQKILTTLGEAAVKLNQARESMALARDQLTAFAEWLRQGNPDET